MTDVWVVFLGAYSDRRAVAVFNSQDAAITAADFLYLPDSRGRRDDVEVEIHKVQTVGIGASLDGGTCIWVDGTTYP